MSKYYNLGQLMVCIAPVFKSKLVKSGNTTITHCRPTHCTMWKSNRTLAVTTYEEDNFKKQSNQLSLPCKIRKDTK